MPRVDLLKQSSIVRTARVKQVEGLFDIPPSERSECKWSCDIPLDDRDWQIGLICGPSGCGKSSIARELFGDICDTSFHWSSSNSLLDDFPDSMSIKEITGLLSSVGFSSPPSWLRPFAVLSTGEQFRVTIARALSESPKLVVIDEFTSVIDRLVAQIGSASVSKAIRRRLGQRFVAVSCHNDVIEWLQPDWIYDPSRDMFQWRLLQRRPNIELRINRVTRDTWRLFRQHHYLSTALSLSAYCFCATVRDHPAAFSSVICTPGKNGGLWREHRTVCLPDFQGVGIGNALSEYVASLFASDKSFVSRTGNPSMNHHRARSLLWKMTARGLSSPHSDKWQRRVGASTRLTCGWRWIGPTRPNEAARFGLRTRKVLRRP